MKKIIAIILAVMLCLPLIACDDGTKAPAVTTDGTTADSHTDASNKETDAPDTTIASGTTAADNTNAVTEEGTATDDTDTATETTKPTATEKPADTTDIAVTTKPAVTTNTPETAKPEDTTAAPEVTTPAVTTAVPEVTTPVTATPPSDTTVAPETTDRDETTAVEPETEKPEETTSSEPETDSPIETDPIPDDTTAAESETTEPEVTEPEDTEPEPDDEESLIVYVAEASGEKYPAINEKLLNDYIEIIEITTDNWKDHLSVLYGEDDVYGGESEKVVLLGVDTNRYHAYSCFELTLKHIGTGEEIRVLFSVMSGFYCYNPGYIGPYENFSDFNIDDYICTSVSGISKIVFFDLPEEAILKTDSEAFHPAFFQNVSGIHNIFNIRNYGNGSISVNPDMPIINADFFSALMNLEIIPW